MTIERLIVRLEQGLYQRLCLLARRKGTTKAALVRSVLEAYCRGEAEPSAFELAQRVGIIGLIKDAPADLSTNPRYLEGFGRDS
ncbi:MAG: hypothetical protein U0836_13270 [Pirellulales bacterium]